MAESPFDPECKLECNNGGYCNFVADNEDILMHIFASGGMIQECVCPPGFSGLACENEVDQCQLPEMKCHNGLPCSYHSGIEAYFCDCSDADQISKFAGSMCRNPATSYCGSGDIKNRSFCTNGGLCLSNIKATLELKDYDTHEGCQCPPEFEGEHCEYLKGMAPNTEGSNPLSMLSEHVKKSMEVKMIDTPQKFDPPAILTQSNEDLPSVTKVMPPTVDAADDSGSSGIFAVFLVTVLSTLGAVMYVHKKRQSEMKARQSKRIAFFGNDESYKDETPIRVKIMSEIENDKGMKLDDLLEGLNDIEEEDEDMGSVSEMTLEEIELENEDRFV